MMAKEAVAALLIVAAVDASLPNRTAPSSYQLTGVESHCFSFLCLGS
jgi:hypothetical protein